MADNISTMSVGFDFHAMTNAVHKYNSLKCMVYVWWPRPFLLLYVALCYRSIFNIIHAPTFLSSIICMIVSTVVFLSVFISFSEQRRHTSYAILFWTYHVDWYYYFMGVILIKARACCKYTHARLCMATIMFIGIQSCMYGQYRHYCYRTAYMEAVDHYYTPCHTYIFACLHRVIKIT